MFQASLGRSRLQGGVLLLTGRNVPGTTRMIRLQDDVLPLTRSNVPAIMGMFQTTGRRSSGHTEECSSHHGDVPDTRVTFVTTGMFRTTGRRSSGHMKECSSHQGDVCHHGNVPDNRATFFWSHGGMFQSPRGCSSAG